MVGVNLEKEKHLMKDYLTLRVTVGSLRALPIR